MSISERANTWIHRQAGAVNSDRATMFWDRVGLFIDRHSNYSEAEWATLLLQEQLHDADPEALFNSPASGCCGCGSWLCDVRTPAWEGGPHGEAYCWKCVDRKRIGEYVVLPGCER